MAYRPHSILFGKLYTGGQGIFFLVNKLGNVMMLTAWKERQGGVFLQGSKIWGKYVFHDLFPFFTSLIFFQ